MSKNFIEQVGDDAFVHTPSGAVVVIDAADVPLVSTRRWTANHGGYAVVQFNGTSQQMHRILLGLGRHNGDDVDHINRDKMDNRRANLRVVTRNQNEHNKGKRKNNTSGFIGVCWDSGKRKWMAFCKRDYRFVCIGRFNDKETAAHAYDKWVIANRDEHATTNFPRSTYQMAA